MPLVEVHGTNLYYESVGEGEPLVCVHGGFFDHDMWAFVVPALAQGHRVVAYDWRGHGKSAGSLSDDPMQVVDDLAEVVERLGLAPADLAGQSAGAGTILHMAARRPELCRSLSLHEPPVVTLLGDELAGVSEAVREAARLLREGDLDEGLRTFVAAVGGDWDLFPEPLKVTFRSNAHNYTAPWFDDLTAALWDAPPELDRLTVPVQLTKGETSPRFFHRIADGLGTRIAGAEVTTVSGGGHAVMLENPEGYAAAVVAFIERARTVRSVNAS